jgi:hypothetical protein
LGVGSFSVKDGRGAKRRIPNGMRGLPRPGRTELRDRLDRARTIAWVRSGEFRVWVRAVVLAVVALGLILLGSSLTGKASRLEVIGALAVFIPVVVLAAQFRRLERELVERTERRMGPYPAVCIECGYDLQELRTESDGCTVCPECGAAWRLAMKAGTA